MTEGPVWVSESTDIPSSTDRGKVQVVGTAHVSEHSVEEVTRTIQEVRPDVVAVELDDGRYRQLRGEAPEDIDASALLRGNTVFQFLAYWLLSYIQKRLGDRFDIEPGADMRAAIESAESLDIGVVLVDRDIQTTIQRFWARMTLGEKVRMIASLFFGMFGFVSIEDNEGIQLEQLTDADVVTAMMEEFRRFSPGGAEALIDERDAYIAHQLVALRDEGYDIVAVVGAGHRDGIERYLERPETLPEIDSLVGTSRRRFSLYRVVGYLLAFGFLTFFFLLAMAGVRDGLLLQLFLAWFLFNGIFAFGMAKLAGARWTSAGVGGGVAWLTSVNPLLAPGWFAGYVELRYTPVNVGDIATLNEIIEDTESSVRDLLGRMLDVPLFRLIAIVAMTNVGSMIATILFPFVVLPWIAAPHGGVSAIGDRMIDGAINSAELLWSLVS